jgi:hypothetical protein
MISINVKPLRRLFFNVFIFLFAGKVSRRFKIQFVKYIAGAIAISVGRAIQFMIKNRFRQKDAHFFDGTGSPVADATS